MRIWDFSRSAFGICAASALLAGCGGSQLPIGESGAMPQNASIAQIDRGGSWMLPDAKHDDLLYVSDFYGVHVFSYPRGTHVGDLTGFASPEGLCTDRAGDVFVTDETVAHVYEYAHGGTNRIATLYDNYVDFNPIDCSVDPVTGNLAVASADAPYVVIFPDAKEHPVVYVDPYASLFWCAYDDKGNLFIEQIRHHRKFYIGELPKGATKFKNFVLDSRAGIPGATKFDGQHVVVEDLRTNGLHQVRFSGSNAVVIDSTPLNGAKEIQQFWIHKGKVIGPDAYGPAYFWKYPLGGSPAKAIQGFTLPVGVTVSLAPH